MAASIKQLRANRSNACASSGPVTDAGKAVASRNAIRYGLLSSRLILEGEDAEDFQAMLSELMGSLRPAGAAEAAIVERVAITIWRQRRLVTAEAASLILARQPDEIAREVNQELALHGNEALDGDDLEPFAQVQIDWCKSVLEELDWFQADTSLDRVPEGLPLTYAQLKEDAEDAELSIEQYLANTTGGLAGYARELRRYCRQQLVNAEARPQALVIAEPVRQHRLVLAPEILEVFTRYQTTLDNQQIRLLKALREAQSWRLQTLDLCNAIPGPMVNAAE